jgi:hypothetical protein
MAVLYSPAALAPILSLAHQSLKWRRWSEDNERLSDWGEVHVFARKHFDE